MQSSVSQHRPSQRERESGQSGKDVLFTPIAALRAAAAHRKSVECLAAPACTLIRRIRAGGEGLGRGRAVGLTGGWLEQAEAPVFAKYARRTPPFPCFVYETDSPFDVSREHGFVDLFCT